VNALSFVAVLVSLLLMRLPSAVTHERSKANAGAGTWEGLRYIRSTPRVLRVLLLIGTASLFAWSASTLYPVFADKFQVGASGFTAMMAANGVGAAGAGLLIAAFGERLPRRALVYGGAVAFAVALLLFAHAPNWNLLLASLVLSGFCMIGFAISANTSVQNDVPDALRGRVMAVYTLVFGGLFPIGGLEIGFLAEHGGGPVTAVTINAAVFLLVAVAVFVWSHLDRRPPTTATLVSDAAAAAS
jgi:MFS family permease